MMGIFFAVFFFASIPAIILGCAAWSEARDVELKQNRLRDLEQRKRELLEGERDRTRKVEEFNNTPYQPTFAKTWKGEATDTVWRRYSCVSTVRMPSRPDQKLEINLNPKWVTSRASHIKWVQTDSACMAADVICFKRPCVITMGLMGDDTGFLWVEGDGVEYGGPFDALDGMRRLPSWVADVLEVSRPR